MKKLLLIISTLFFITACGGGGGGGGSSEQTPAIKHTVTFNLNGGNIKGNTDNIKVEILDNTQLTGIQVPEKSGMNFLKWNTHKDGSGEDLKLSNPVKSSITYYAQWSSGTTATVTFKLNGGKLNNSTTDIAIQIAVSGKVTPPGVPTKTGQSFVGWYDNSNDVANFDKPVYADIVFNAKWADPNIIRTVFFDLDGGELNGSTDEIEIDVADGQKVSSPGIPVKTGFVFIGWYGMFEEVDFNKPIIADTFYYAKWADTSIKHTITFDLKGGSVNGSTSDILKQVQEGQKVSAPDTPVKAGAVFTGWKTIVNMHEVDVDFDKAILSSVTYYASWRNTHHTITFDLNGGTLNGSTDNIVKTVADNNKIANPGIPANDGFIFNGWYDSYDAPVNFNDPITEDRTYYANWKIKPVTVQAQFSFNTKITPAAVDIYDTTAAVGSAEGLVNVYHFDGTEWILENSLDHVNPVGRIVVSDADTIISADSDKNDEPVKIIIWKKISGIWSSVATLNHNGVNDIAAYGDTIVSSGDGVKVWTKTGSSWSSVNITNDENYFITIYDDVIALLNENIEIWKKSGSIWTKTATLSASYHSTLKLIDNDTLAAGDTIYTYSGGLWNDTATLDDDAIDTYGDKIVSVSGNNTIIYTINGGNWKKTASFSNGSYVVSAAIYENTVVSIGYDYVNFWTKGIGEHWGHTKSYTSYKYDYYTTGTNGNTIALGGDKISVFTKADWSNTDISLPDNFRIFAIAVPNDNKIIAGGVDTSTFEGIIKIFEKSSDSWSESTSISHTSSITQLHLLGNGAIVSASNNEINIWTESSGNWTSTVLTSDSNFAVINDSAIATSGTNLNIWVESGGSWTSTELDTNTSNVAVHNNIMVSDKLGDIKVWKYSGGNWMPDGTLSHIAIGTKLSVYNGMIATSGSGKVIIWKDDGGGWENLSTSVLGGAGDVKFVTDSMAMVKRSTDIAFLEKGDNWDSLKDFNYSNTSDIAKIDEDNIVTANAKSIVIWTNDGIEWEKTQEIDIRIRKLSAAAGVIIAKTYNDEFVKFIYDGSTWIKEGIGFVSDAIPLKNKAIAIFHGTQIDIKDKDGYETYTDSFAYAHDFHAYDNTVAVSNDNQLLLYRFNGTAWERTVIDTEGILEVNAYKDMVVTYNYDDEFKIWKHNGTDWIGTVFTQESSSNVVILNENKLLIHTYDGLTVWEGNEIWKRTVFIENLSADSRYDDSTFLSIKYGVTVEGLSIQN